MSSCQHAWRWLPRARVVIAPIGQPNEHYNVECSRCGALGWAHGRMPFGYPLAVEHAPTTRRS